MPFKKVKYFVNESGEIFSSSLYKDDIFWKINSKIFLSASIFRINSFIKFIIDFLTVSFVFSSKYNLNKNIKIGDLFSFTEKYSEIHLCSFII